MSEALELIILPERPVVRNDGRSELDVVVEIRCAQAVRSARAVRASNLCIVLDRSGSMAGAKLDTAKRSCIDVFNRLGENDLFTVVVFDQEARVIVNPQTPRAEVIGKIQAISEGGETNLSLGWYLGLLEAQTHMTDGHTTRVLLLSDGQANAGETKRSTLAREAAQARELGITTSTIGIGTDFQEDLLAAIATESGGRFWYIQESRIEDIIDEEFQGSLSVVLDRPRVELVLPDGVTVSRELNALAKVSGKYRVRPLKGQDVFNFAVRLEAVPEQLPAGEFAVTAVLYDGEKRVGEGTRVLRLVPPEEFVLSEADVLVRSVVQQYEASKTTEQRLDTMAAGDLSLMKRMLVTEVEGCRAVRDALADQRETERTLLEIRHLTMDLSSKEASLGVAEMLEEFAATPEVCSFLLRWRKIDMQGLTRVQSRTIAVCEFDGEPVADLLRSALDLADTLAERYPDRAARLAEHQEKLRERLARC